MCVHMDVYVICVDVYMIVYIFTFLAKRRRKNTPYREYVVTGRLQITVTVNHRTTAAIDRLPTYVHLHDSPTLWLLHEQVKCLMARSLDPKFQTKRTGWPSGGAATTPPQ